MPLEEDALLNRKQLQQVVPVSTMSLFRWMRDGRFPKPLKIAGRNFWRAREIKSWIASHEGARVA